MEKFLKKKERKKKGIETQETLMKSLPREITKALIL